MEIVYEFVNLIGLKYLLFKIVVRFVFRDAARQVCGRN